MHKKLAMVLSVTLVLLGCQQEPLEETQKENGNEYMDMDEGLLSSANVLNVAHRGASGHAPEHTMASYEMGEEMGADYIEIDLQMTRDGELVAMHDEDVSRTTDGVGDVGDFTLAEIKRLDAGSWFNQAHPDDADPSYQNERVLNLDDIFDTFGKDANYYIETKYPEKSPNMVQKLLETLEAHHLLNDNDVDEGQVLIQSCSKESLKKIHARHDSIPLIQLICFDSKGGLLYGQLDEISDYAVGIGINHHYISRDYVQKVRRKGLLLHPFTVNEKSDMKRLIDWGATGFFTNYPDRLNEVLDGMKE